LAGPTGSVVAAGGYGPPAPGTGALRMGGLRGFGQAVGGLLAGDIRLLPSDPIAEAGLVYLRKGLGCIRRRRLLTLSIGGFAVRLEGEVQDPDRIKKDRLYEAIPAAL
jgi:hypothetical protein